MFLLRVIWAIVRALVSKKADPAAENLALHQHLIVLRRRITGTAIGITIHRTMAPYSLSRCGGSRRIELLVETAQVFAATQRASLPTVRPWTRMEKTTTV